jgi:hypothetical protein
MAKKTPTRTYNDVLSTLGSEKFDVSPAGHGASRVSGANRVSKYGCAAEIAPLPADDKSRADSGAFVRVTVRPGWVLGGDIATLVDRGYQKFIKTPKLEIPATADTLRALHRFNEELTEAAGGLVLYNESLGTTSDEYVYDRVKGREAG